jgi:hypothetical protein
MHFEGLTKSREFLMRLALIPAFSATSAIEVVTSLIIFGASSVMTDGFSAKPVDSALTSTNCGGRGVGDEGGFRPGYLGVDAHVNKH